MLFVHESNLKTKISNDYYNKKSELEDFYNNEYLPVKQKLLNLNFSQTNIENFKVATIIFNEYSLKLNEFSRKHNITSQSKFESTFLEEISTYLFKDLEQIKTGKYSFFNKKIYAGLKINKDDTISIITKDVDFCIAKKISLTINQQVPINLLLPIVSVEVKTYLDATMFGEVKSSSKAIRSASPNSKTYVLLGHKELRDEHIVAARYDSYLNEMFCLKAHAGAPISHYVIYDYWHTIVEDVNSIGKDITIEVPGKLLFPDNLMD